MNKQAEPKSADFLLSKSPSTIQNKLTVRSGEARQSSQVGGDFSYGEEWRKKISESLKRIGMKPPYNHPKTKATQFKKGELNPNWKGGKKFKYVSIKKPEHPFSYPSGYVLEHRLVVEEQIGRYLKSKETTHHLGKENDNRPHMLMAFVNSAAHTRFHYNPSLVKPEEIIFDGRKLNRNRGSQC